MAGVGSCWREDLPVKRDFQSFKITLPPPVSFHQSFPLEAEDKDENSVPGIMDLHIPAIFCLQEAVYYLSPFPSSIRPVCSYNKRKLVI